MNRFEKKGYPANWESVSRQCKQRDHYTCQHCLAKQNEKKKGRNGYYRVIIAAAHIDHKLVNHELDNLISLCQTCHYIYDHGGTDYVIKYNANRNNHKRNFPAGK